MTYGWLFFGCGRREAGHYLFSPGGSARVDRTIMSRFERFDGMLCPLQEEGNLYVAALSRLGPIGYSTLAWWDRTMDKRPRCNSIVFAPSLTVSPETIMQGARQYFPWAISRLPQELVLPEDFSKQVVPDEVS